MVEVCGPASTDFTVLVVPPKREVASEKPGAVEVPVPGLGEAQQLGFSWLPPCRRGCLGKCEEDAPAEALGRLRRSCVWATQEVLVAVGTAAARQHESQPARVA